MMSLIGFLSAMMRLVFSLADRSINHRIATRATLALPMLLALAACGGGGGEGAPSPSTPAPTGLSYTQPQALIVGDVMPVLQPSVTGQVDAYAVSPSLPGGVSLDAKSGVISGTPEDAVDDVSYVVTASNSGGSTTFSLRLTSVAKEHTEKASSGVLSLNSEIDPRRFIATTAALRINLTGAQLGTDASTVRVLKNGSLINLPIQVVGNQIVANGVLTEGRNDLVVLAEDSTGSSLSFKTTLWAGSQTLTINIRDQNGATPAGATLAASLSDDPTVGLTVVTATGQVVLDNVPDRTILLSATGTNNQIANVTTVGAAGVVQMSLSGLKAASSVDNNDFSQGLNGWDVSNAPNAALVPHTETIALGVSAGVATLSTDSSRAARASLWEGRGRKHVLALNAKPLAAAQDQDLQITTSGEGPSSVSRTFQVKSGTSKVMIRFRFVTSEVPGGYFGSQYNDSYAITVRSAQAASVVSDANSMNGLGLPAFSADGSTAWRTLSLPVTSTGDTVQIDLTVTNVGDGAFDSQLVVDYVSEDDFSIAASSTEVCPNETVTFTASGAAAAQAAWSGGGTPATATGASFVTRYASDGQYTGTASANGKTASAQVRVKQSSGASWVAQFPTSTSTADLEASFKSSVENFISALNTAGATVNISATYRPPERAYLMHYSYRIAKDGLDPAGVPAMAGVNICWVHRNVQGQADNAGAKSAANAMVNGYGIVYAPALESRHTQKLAIDMSIGWTGDLKIKNADGTETTITSTPRTGAGNTDLHTVGGGYGAKKLVSDAPHWSDDGH
jgi:hypothetical protein